MLPLNKDNWFKAFLVGYFWWNNLTRIRLSVIRLFVLMFLNKHPHSKQAYVIAKTKVWKGILNILYALDLSASSMIWYRFNLYTTPKLCHAKPILTSFCLVCLQWYCLYKENISSVSTNGDDLYPPSFTI